MLKRALAKTAATKSVPTGCPSMVKREKKVRRKELLRQFNL